MKTTTSQHGERCLWRRSWSVGIATALLAAAPFVASGQNDGSTGGENTIATYKGVSDLPGHTSEELKDGITTDCSYDNPSKVYSSTTWERASFSTWEATGARMPL